MRRHESDGRGFTLVEVIIVIFIVGLSLSLVLGLTVRQQATVQLQGTARELYAFLKVARGYAIVQGRDNPCTYLPQRNAVQEALKGRILELPKGMSLAPRPDDDPAKDRIVAEFYADGSATGGELKLVLGDKALVLTIDPVLGEAKIRKEAADLDAS
jgi:general secretion pathway protein H